MLGLFLAVCCFPHVGGLSVSQLYPFGIAAGDHTLDEGSSSGITLATPFIFFGTAQSFVYVSPCLHFTVFIAGIVNQH